MYIALLSGGSGKRLWPLSNDLWSKQYIKVLESPYDGKTVSMVQRVWQQLAHTGLQENAIVCAGESQCELLRSQLGSGIRIVVEPERRNTFPAVALSASYLFSRLHASFEDTVIVLPIDPYVDDSYFENLKKLDECLHSSGADIALMGAKPTYPSEKYGYLVPKEQKEGYFTIDRFKEKPSVEEARELIEGHALWNCGVFCFRIGFILDLLETFQAPTEYQELFNHYDLLPKNSFDYEVLEKAKSLIAVPFDGMWKDIGTWNTLSEEMRSDTYGNVIMGKNCSGSHVVNTLAIPLAVSDIHDLIVAATYDGVLVTSKKDSPAIKELLKDLKGIPMYEERLWGTIKTLDVTTTEGMLTITRKVRIYQGAKMTCHMHPHCQEVWTVLKGKVELDLGGDKKTYTAPSSFTIMKGRKHTIIALEETEGIEIHLGESEETTDY